MRYRPRLFILLALTVASRLAAQTTQPAPMRLEPAWLKPPTFVDAPEFKADGVRAVFFDSIALNGKPTRAFAWIGLPKTESGDRREVPAMVLVHGGGGTAFDAWVRLWTSRGYAAIAMDTCGQIPRGTYSRWQRDPQGGPSGWGGFDQVDRPPQDQWTYHAVADVVLAHSLIRSLPEVDPDRVGLTGISWGGYLTCIVAGLDDRFKLAVLVYGCGFLGDDSTWRDKLQKMGEDGADWLARWDPSHYLPSAKMPMLWVDGTNDFAYPMDSLQRSYRLPSGPHTICLRIGMKHGHGGPGENPEEIHAFADAILKGGKPLATIVDWGCEKDEEFWVKFRSAVPIVNAEMCYTEQDGPWQKRPWKTTAGTIDRAAGIARVKVPHNAMVLYVNLIDANGLLVSSEHVELETQEGPLVHNVRASGSMEEFNRLVQDKELVHLEGARALLWASTGGRDEPKGIALVEHGADVNWQTCMRETPLYLAAASPNQSKLAKALIDRGATVNTRCRNQLTALHQATVYSNPEMVAYLLDHGADVNAIMDEGNTPLSAAAEFPFCSRLPDIVQLLVDHGADVNVEDNDGKTALDYLQSSPHGAADAPAREIEASVKILLAHGAGNGHPKPSK
jgi:dienelactone hydrolase